MSSRGRKGENDRMYMIMCLKVIDSRVRIQHAAETFPSFEHNRSPCLQSIEKEIVSSRLREEKGDTSRRWTAKYHRNQLLGLNCLGGPSAARVRCYSAGLPPNLSRAAQKFIVEALCVPVRQRTVVNYRESEDSPLALSFPSDVHAYTATRAFGAGKAIDAIQ